MQNAVKNRLQSVQFGTAQIYKNIALLPIVFDEILASDERAFRSIGYGIDHRYKGKALAGAALVRMDEVIHAAFFRLDDAEQPQPERMASYRSRRRFGR